MYRGINNIIRQNCEDKCEIGNSEDSVKLLNIFRSGFLKIKKPLLHHRGRGERPRRLRRRQRAQAQGPDDQGEGRRGPRGVKKRGFWSDVSVLTGDLDGAERVTRVGASSGGV